jgi:hypothetical protein
MRKLRRLSIEPFSSSFFASIFQLQLRAKRAYQKFVKDLNQAASLMGRRSARPVSWDKKKFVRQMAGCPISRAFCEKVGKGKR